MRNTQITGWHSLINKLKDHHHLTKSQPHPKLSVPPEGQVVWKPRR